MPLFFNLSVQKNALPHFERQQLEDVQAVVLAPRQVLADDAPDLRGAEEAAASDHLLRKQVVNERAQRPAQPRAYRRAEARLLSPHNVARQKAFGGARSEEHTSELQSLAYLVCRLLLEKKKTNNINKVHDTKHQ